MSATKEQQAFIDWNGGPVVLNSGAGTGKTHSIIGRYESQLARGVLPNKILCITFTNKAATELKQRVLNKLPHLDSNMLHVFTFHGLCNYWLRLRGDEIGLPRFQIMNASQSTSLIRTIASKTLLNPKSSFECEKPIPKINLITRVLSKIDATYGLNVGQAIELCSIKRPLEITFVKSCFQEYIKYKKSMHKLDFTDLMTFGIYLFKKTDLATYYDHIICDEMQDNSAKNLELLYTLSHNKQIMACADHKQSIYGFRGASTVSVQQFIKQFNATELFLTKNFRSDKKIVALANNTIRRQEEKMVPHSTKEGVLSYVEFPTAAHETNWITKRIISFEKRLNTDVRDYSKYAILYRVKSISSSYERSLRAANIPYNISGNNSFYKQREILDITALLDWIVNPSSLEDLERVCKNFKLGVGPAYIAKIYNSSHIADITHKTMIRTIEAGQNKRPKHLWPLKAQAFHDLARMVVQVKDMYQHSAYDAMVKIYKDMDLNKKLKEQDTVDHLKGVNKDGSRRESVIEFIKSANDRAYTLQEFIDSVSLFNDVEKEDSNAITLSTIHSAKGKEWDCVFMVSVSDGYLPHKMSFSNDEDLQQELNCYYVAKTRARNKLFMSRHTCTKDFSGKSTYQAMSRFVKSNLPTLKRIGEVHLS